MDIAEFFDSLCRAIRAAGGEPPTVKHMATMTVKELADLVACNGIRFVCNLETQRKVAIEKAVREPIPEPLMLAVAAPFLIAALDDMLRGKK